MSEHDEQNAAPDVPIMLIESSSNRLSEPAERLRPDGDVAFIEIVNLFLRHHVLIGGIALAGVLIAGLVFALSPREYMAESAFMPESGGGNRSQLSGLAAQFGITMGGDEGTQSLDFYGALIQSGPILREVVQTQYQVSVGSDGEVRTQTLLQVFEVEGPTLESRLRQAVALLRQNVTVSVNVSTGLVHLRTTAPLPELAEAVNARILALVEEYNMSTRRSRARRERQFLAERTEAAEQQLVAAEEALAEFQRQNRTYVGSPDLRLVADGLERRVSFRQQVYTSLAQAYEQAEINEIRETPVVTIIEPPQNTSRPTRAGLAVFLAFGALAGLFLAAAVVLVRHYYQQHKTLHPAEFREFEARTRSLMLLRQHRPGKETPRG